MDVLEGRLREEQASSLKALEGIIAQAGLTGVAPGGRIDQRQG